ncbi:MAG: hypothetical protein M1826_001213 [Phylliscum demangeonii]|nr:MAG: hypothetical protein M1826_001213 [Phylliscum demangeonii]
MALQQPAKVKAGFVSFPPTSIPKRPLFKMFIWTPASANRQSCHNTAIAAWKRCQENAKAAKQKFTEKEPVMLQARKGIPGINILREIRFYQKSVGLIISKTRFWNLVRELCEDLQRELRFYATGLDALQEQAEQYLTGIFEIVTLAAMHAGRQTIMVRDFNLIKKVTQQKLAFAVTDDTAPALGAIKKADQPLPRCGPAPQAQPASHRKTAKTTKKGGPRKKPARQKWRKGRRSKPIEGATTTETIDLEASPGENTQTGGVKQAGVEAETGENELGGGNELEEDGPGDKNGQGGDDGNGGGNGEGGGDGEGGDDGDA